MSTPTPSLSFSQVALGAVFGAFGIVAMQRTEIHESVRGLYQRLFTTERVTESVVTLIATSTSTKHIQYDRYPAEHRRSISSALSFTKAEKMRIVSYNLKTWPEACKRTHCDNKLVDRVALLLRNTDCDLICMQELYSADAQALLERIKDTFDYFCDKNFEGEANGLFFRKDRFKLDEECNDSQDPLANGAKTLTYHYQDTVKPVQNEPGQYATVAHFIDLKTQKKLVVVNTHLTSKIDSKAIQANQIATDILKPLAAKKPVIFAGDLNCFPNFPTLVPALQVPSLDGNEINMTIQQQNGMKNSFDTSLLGHIPGAVSIQKVPVETLAQHLYVSKGITVLIRATETAKVDGDYPSSSLPLIADILLKA